MEDKKVLEFVNKNYEESHNKWVKQQKKKHRREKIWTIIYVLALISVVFILIKVVSYETEKGLRFCLKQGYSENYCYRGL